MANSQKETASLSWVKGFINLLEEKGAKKVIVSILLSLVVALGFLSFSLIGYFALNPEKIFDKYEAYSEARHAASFNYRMESSPMVQSYLDQMLLETNAKRCFIIEMHNGKYNAAGLSFNYGALTYESDRSDSYSVMEDYADFSLERYPLANKIYNEGFWGGSIAELMAIDRHLALKIDSNDASYLMVTTIYGTKGEIGFLGLTLEDETQYNPKTLKASLLKYSSKISPLLDGANAKQ